MWYNLLIIKIALKVGWPTAKIHNGGVGVQVSNITRKGTL